MNRNEFIETVANLVVSENNKRGNPLFSSVVIAQACLETGYGSSSIMLGANAIFGIKATNSWKGKVYNAKTKECYDSINYVTIQDCFRAYDSFEESIEDYFNLICSFSRYSGALNTSSPEECITAIKNGGYATDTSYVSKVMNIISSFNLTKYDSNVIMEEVTNHYTIGEVYTTKVILNVRESASVDSRKLSYSELTENAKEHAYKTGVNAGCLKNGTRVTCKDVVEENGDVWIKIPSGFIAGIYNGKTYVE